MALRIKRRPQLIYIQFIFPFGGHYGGDAVADEVGQGAGFRHEAVYAEYQRKPGDRDGRHGGQRRRQRDETAQEDFTRYKM